MTTPSLWVQEMKKSWHQLSTSLQSDVIIYAGPLFNDQEMIFRQKMENSEKKNPNGILFLSTYGGSADCAFRICRLLHNRYAGGQLRVLVSSYCKSAGTLIVLGANELIMCDNAELGPLDVQLLHRDVAERASGLIPTHALATLRQQVSMTFEEVFLHIRKMTRLASENAAEVAGQMVAGLYQGIYGKLDPFKIGENDRAMVIAEEYGNRLAAKRGLVKAITIRKLISGYPSHEFVIDREEASEIFSRIRQPSSEEQQLVDLLKPLCDAALMPTGKPLIDQLDFSDDASITPHSSSEKSDAPNTAAECNRASESSGGTRDTSGKVVEGPTG